MSQAVPTRPAAPPPKVASDSRPRLLDYLLIFCGCAISLVLVDLSGWKIQLESRYLLVQAFLQTIPQLLFLPLGIILLWPFFYSTQRLLGRQQGLTAAEWLWGLAWLAGLVLSSWILWKALGSPPEFLTSPGFRENVSLAYGVFVVSMAVISAILVLVGIVLRRPQPWTHHFALALLIWPVLPLAAWFTSK